MSFELTVSKADFFDIIKGFGSNLNTTDGWISKDDGSFVQRYDPENGAMILGNMIRGIEISPSNHLYTKTSDGATFCYVIWLRRENNYLVKITDEFLILLQQHMTKIRENLGCHQLRDFMSFSLLTSNNINNMTQVTNKAVEEITELELTNYWFHKLCGQKIKLVETFDNPYCRTFIMDGKHIDVEAFKKSIQTMNEINLKRGYWVCSHDSTLMIARYVFMNNEPFKRLFCLHSDMFKDIIDFLDAVDNPMGVDISNRDLLLIYKTLIKQNYIKP